MLGTGAAWRCARSGAAGWIEPAFDDASWTAVEVISGFEESLWARHPLGPPRLDASSPAERPVFRQTPLAMSWHEREKAKEILAFDTRPRAARPAGWYRFRSPPGLRAMTITARGKVRAWADGREMGVAPGHRSDRCVATVSTPSPGCAAVALRIEQERGAYGGAALEEPILLDCGPGLIDAGDWSRIDGLASYSGGAWYRRRVDLTAEQLAGSVTLDLGGVVASAEVRVNGRLAGIRVAPPWRVDIAGLVHAGENRIEVLIYNTLANHYLTIPTRYRGSSASGLLGPARIDFAAE